ALVETGRFRRDLYYRLNVIELRMPALRECREDIPLIAARILERLAQQNSSPLHRLSEAAVAELLQYDFPGNVRELENTLERAVALSTNEELQPGDLALHRMGSEAEMLVESAASAPDTVLDRPLPAYLDGIERKAILDALARTGFNRTAAAKLLGITFRALRYRMQRLGIREPAAGGGAAVGRGGESGSLRRAAARPRERVRPRRAASRRAAPAFTEQRLPSRGRPGDA